MTTTLPKHFKFSCYDNIYTADVLSEEIDYSDYEVKWMHDGGGSVRYAAATMKAYMDSNSATGWKMVNEEPNVVKPTRACEFLSQGDRITMMNGDIFVYSHRDRNDIYFYNTIQEKMDYYVETYMEHHILTIHAAPKYISEIFNASFVAGIKYKSIKNSEIKKVQAELKKLLADRVKLSDLISTTEDKLYALSK